MTNQATMILLSREETERLGFWDGYTEEQKEKCSYWTKRLWLRILELDNKNKKEQNND